MTLTPVLPLGLAGFGILLFLAVPLIGKVVRGTNDKFTEPQGCAMLGLMLAGLLFIFTGAACAYYSQHP